MDENCHVEPLQKNATPAERQSTTSVLLAVEGMGCSNCAARVRNGLLALTGVVEAYVVLDESMADVTYNPGLADVPALIAGVARAGGDGRHNYRALVIDGPAVTVGRSV